MQIPTCSSCDYYAAMEGQCRRNPPMCIPIPQPGGTFGTASFWPPCRDMQWCGEHSALKQRGEAEVISISGMKS